MLTAFVLFNDVYISLPRMKTHTFRRMQTEWLLPLIPVGSCVSARSTQNNFLSLSLCLLSHPDSSPSLSFSRSQHVKAAGSHKHQLGLLFAYQMCSVVSRSKKKKSKTRSNRRLRRAWQKGEKIIIVVYLKTGLDCKLGAGF